MVKFPKNFPPKSFKSSGFTGLRAKLQVAFLKADIKKSEKMIMSNEVQLELDTDEKFRSILVKELEHTLELAKNLDLTKENGLRNISDHISQVNGNVNDRLSYISRIRLENERLEALASATDARKQKRNTASLREAAKTPAHDTEDKNV